MGLRLCGLFAPTVRRRGRSERLFAMGLRMLDRSRLGESGRDFRQSRAGQHLHQGNRAPDGDAQASHRHAQAETGDGDAKTANGDAASPNGHAATANGDA